MRTKLFGTIFGLFLFSSLHCMDWKDVKNLQLSSSPERRYSRRERIYRELNGLAPKPKMPKSDPIPIPGVRIRFLPVVKED